MKEAVRYDHGEISVELEVDANGATHTCQQSAANKDAAEKKAAMDILDMLKGNELHRRGHAQPRLS